VWALLPSSEQGKTRGAMVMRCDPYGRFAPDCRGQRLLDLSCGTGSLIERILVARPAIGPVTGVDVSAGILRQARARLAGWSGRREVALVQQRLQHLDFRDAAFDIVVCVNALHYFREQQLILREVARVLRPGVLFVLEDYAKGGLLARYFAWAIRRYDPAHQRAYHLAEATRHLARAGWPPAIYTSNFRIDSLWRGWIIVARRGNEGVGAISAVA
jgi:ubiquinone/menaquinone biosynthesis C-methylase UbiE